MKMRCPHCKEEFFVARGLMREYVYKIGKVYYCSYPCWGLNGGGK